MQSQESIIVRELAAEGLTRFACLLKSVDYDDNDCLPVKLDDDEWMERANADDSEDRLMKRSHARTGCRCVSEQEAARVVAPAGLQRMLGNNRRSRLLR